MYEHNALGYSSGLALCLTQSRRVTYLDPRDCEINSNTSVGQVDSN